MSDQPTPSLAAVNGLRWYVRLTRWLWWLVMGFWSLMLLSTVTLHWLIVPRILDWQPQIEAMASQAWGVKVSIGELQSESDGWVPSFVLTDFVLRDQQDQEVLRLPRVRISLSPASLLSLTLDSIDLQAPQLEIMRDQQGHWQIAGMPIGGADDSSMADWLLRQPNISIHDGRLRWVDRMLQQPEVDLTAVNVTLRNGLRSHAWRFDALPPPEWGQAISIQGRFNQALLNGRASDITTWKGSFYAQMPHVDIPRLAAYAKAYLNIEIQSGEGWLRAWADIDNGVWNNQTVDVGLRDVKVKLAQQLDDIHFQQIEGRLRLQSWMGSLGQELVTEHIKVTPAQGPSWSSGKTRFAWRHASHAQEPWASTGEIQIEDMPLEVISRIAQRIPMDENMHALMAQTQPRGQLHALKMQWFDAHTPGFHFKASGQVKGLEVNASPAHKTPRPEDDWWPGVTGATVEFELDESSGKAQVSVQDGSVTLVDWLEEPVVPLKTFSTTLSWTKVNQLLKLQLQNARLANADTQGSFDLTWSERDSKLPQGHLELDAQIQRMQASRLYRYLPLEMQAEARQYVKEATGAGWFEKVSVQIKGHMDHFPFNKTNDGVFMVRAPFQQLGFQYSPAPAPAPSVLGKRAAPRWPALQQLTGELSINRNQMQLKSTSARIGQPVALQLTRLEVQIPDLNDIVVDVSAQLKGSLNDALVIINNSPLAESVGSLFNPAGVSGLAEHQFHLIVPVSNLDNTKLQGSVNLLGNDIQLQPPVPKIYKAKGVVNYTQSSMSVQNAKLSLLGGEARLDGGLRFADGAPEAQTRLVLQGSVSADAIKQAPELVSMSGVWAKLKGSTSYIATMGLSQGVPELTILSNLQGMAIDLPEPLDKRASALLPMRYETTVLGSSAGRSHPSLEQMRFTLGQLLSLNYVRDISGAVPTVLRGNLQLGNLPAPKEASDQSVVLQIKQPYLNMDEWQPVLASWMEDEPPAKGNAPTKNSAAAYMPTKIDIQAQDLVWSGRTFSQFQASAEKQPKQWRIQARANEFQGSMDYRPALDGASARITARLSHLTIPPSVLEEVESTLSESPKDMPALDIVIDNLELRGVAMGRAEIEGFARTNTAGSREWVLSKLNLTLPEASFQSKGQWGGAAKAVAKRSQLEFTLQIQDSGELLDRLGYKGAIRNGKGRMVGQVSWQGSPFSPDYNSMNGQFNVNMERGQFLKTEPGVARLLGVLSLQSLPRRLMLDFSDLFSEGFLFDFVRGDVTIQQGIASTNNLQMKGVSAAVLMEGKADIKNETQDLKVVIVPELNAGTASLVYSAINPLVGLTTFLAQYVLRKPLIKSNTEEFHVQGTWKEPKVTKVEDAQPDAKTPAPAKPGAVKP